MSTVHVGIKVPLSMRQQLRQIAAERRETVSTVLRRMARRGIEEELPGSRA